MEFKIPIRTQYEHMNMEFKTQPPVHHWLAAIRQPTHALQAVMQSHNGELQTASLCRRVNGIEK